MRSEDFPKKYQNIILDMWLMSLESCMRNLEITKGNLEQFSFPNFVVTRLKGLLQ